MDEDELDPRIQVELEKLNTATDEINKLEIELDEANTTFRMLLGECTRRLKVHSSKHGSAIVSARPYYEALDLARSAQQECQQAAVSFQRANEVHEAAKETVALAEARFMSQPEWRFDSAWQEMLNHATLKVRDAEKQRADTAAYHGAATAKYKNAQDKVQQLEQRLRRNVSKSRPYFEEKQRCNDQLAAQKEVVESLQSHVAKVKSGYASSLRRLEGISEEIHRKRASIMAACCGIREPGVGAELEYKGELDRCDEPLSLPTRTVLSSEGRQGETDNTPTTCKTQDETKVKSLHGSPSEMSATLQNTRKNTADNLLVEKLGRQKEALESCDGEMNLPGSLGGKGEPLSDFHSGRGEPASKPGFVSSNEDASLPELHSGKGEQGDKAATGAYGQGGSGESGRKTNEASTISREEEVSKVDPGLSRQQELESSDENEEQTDDLDIVLSAKLTLGERTARVDSRTNGTTAIGRGDSMTVIQETVDHSKRVHSGFALEASSNLKVCDVQEKSFDEVKSSASNIKNETCLDVQLKSAEEQSFKTEGCSGFVYNTETKIDADNNLHAETDVSSACMRNKPVFTSAQLNVALEESSEDSKKGPNAVTSICNIQDENCEELKTESPGRTTDALVSGDASSKRAALVTSNVSLESEQAVVDEATENSITTEVNSDVDHDS